MRILLTFLWVISWLRFAVFGLHNVTVDDNDPSIKYSGDWLVSSPSTSLDYGGFHHFSTDPSASASFSFTGTAIYFMSPLWPANNAVVVQLVLDSFQPSILYLQDFTSNRGGVETVNSSVLWSMNGLANAEHLLTVSFVSGKEYAVLDALIYTVEDTFNTTALTAAIVATTNASSTAQATAQATASTTTTSTSSSQSNIPAASSPSSETVAFTADLATSSITTHLPSSTATPTDTPSSNVTPSLPLSSNHNLPVMNIVLGIALGVVGLAFLVVAFLLIRRCKQDRGGPNSISPWVYPDRPHLLPLLSLPYTSDSLRSDSPKTPSSACESSGSVFPPCNTAGKRGEKGGAARGVRAFVSSGSPHGTKKPRRDFIAKGQGNENPPGYEASCSEATRNR